MSTFVDWLSFRLPLGVLRPVQGGEIVRLDASGKVERSTRLHAPVEGSYSAKMLVRSRWEGSDRSCLEVSGNPYKFLHGHNVWGSSDMRSLVVSVARRICEVLQLPYDSDELGRWSAGDVELTRVDLTRMYRLPPGRVASWLSVAGASVRSGRQRTRAIGEETVYVGQGSTRSTLKFYDKAAEIAAHPEHLRADGVARQLLLVWVQDTLRVEVQVRSKVLQEQGLRCGSAWCPQVMDRVLEEHMAKVTLADNLELAEPELPELPRRLIPVYDAWKSGRRLCGDVYPRATFYRYRAQLLEYGIDIAQVRPRLVAPQERAYPLGAPLASFLREPLEPPSWAAELEGLAAVV